MAGTNVKLEIMVVACNLLVAGTNIRLQTRVIAGDAGCYNVRLEMMMIMTRMRTVLVSLCMSLKYNGCFSLHQKQFCFMALNVIF